MPLRLPFPRWTGPASPARVRDPGMSGEENLVAASRAGDSDAFRQLYQANVGRVYAVCLRLAGDRTRAEELTQDVFVHVWERLDRFEGRSAFSTWLHRVAVNLTLMALRRDRRREFRFEAALSEESCFPAGRPAMVEESLDLEQAITRLPPACRTVFVLFDVEGWPHAEIADQLDIAVGTSKAHLFRARQLLREMLS